MSQTPGENHTQSGFKERNRRIHIEKTKPLRDEEGRRLVTRNGYRREREIQAFLPLLYLNGVATGDRINQYLRGPISQNGDVPDERRRGMAERNPIESSFSTGKTLAMMFKLSQQVEKGWRKLRGFKEIGFVLEGKPYHNGTRTENVVA